MDRSELERRVGAMSAEDVRVFAKMVGIVPHYQGTGRNGYRGPMYHAKGKLVAMIFDQAQLSDIESALSRFGKSGAHTHPSYLPPTTEPVEPVGEEPTPTPSGTVDSAVASLVASLVERVTPKAPTLDIETVRDIVAKEVSDAVAKHVAPVTRVELVAPSGAVTMIEGAHAALPDIAKAVSVNVPVILIGPAGSGKSTLGRHVSRALGQSECSVMSICRQTSKYELTGYMHGTVPVRTAVRERWEFGGTLILDEVDNGDANTLAVTNALAERGTPDFAFPDAVVPRHPDFRLICTANTFGYGADRVYVGRNQLDGAFLDRFADFNIDYDEALEDRLAGNPEWVARVRRIRRAVSTLKLRYIVSPRASIHGALLLAAGLPQSKVEEAVLWKGMDADSRARVNSHA